MHNIAVETMLLLPFYSFESLESNPYDHCSTRSDFFMRFVGHTGFDLMNVSCRLVLWILLMKPGCLGESFLRCQFAGIHGRGWVSLCIVNGWEGEVVDVTALTNSIQSGCNYQYATATHLSITSLLTHSTRCFCAFGRQLPQIEVYSASSRTVDSQFTRCLAQAQLHLANYWTPPTIFASLQVDHMRGGFNQFGEVEIFENWEVERGCKLNSRLVVSLKG